MLHKNWPPLTSSVAVRLLHLTKNERPASKNDPFGSKLISFAFLLPSCSEAIFIAGYLPRVATLENGQETTLQDIHTTYPRTHVPLACAFLNPNSASATQHNAPGNLCVCMRGSAQQRKRARSATTKL